MLTLVLVLWCFVSDIGSGSGIEDWIQLIGCAGISKYVFPLIDGSPGAAVERPGSFFAASLARLR